MTNRGGKLFYAYFTLVPTEQFALRDLVKGKTSFRGAIYGGHFESQGKVLFEDAEITIKNIAFWKELNPQEQRPQQAHYVAFGSPKETFLAHIISTPLNYDQIIRVKSDEDKPLSAGTLVKADRKDTNEEIIKEGQHAAGVRLQVDRGGNPRIEIPFPFKIVSQYYLEKNELAKNFLSPK